MDLILISILGFSIVFVVLMLISFVITITSKLLSISQKNKTSTLQTPVSMQQAKPSNIPRPPVILENVEDETAALIMAIVCEKSEIPIENLVFKSIRLVEGK